VACRTCGLAHFFLRWEMFCGLYCCLLEMVNSHWAELLVTKHQRCGWRCRRCRHYGCFRGWWFLALILWKISKGIYEYKDFYSKKNPFVWRNLYVILDEWIGLFLVVCFDYQSVFVFEITNDNHDKVNKYPYSQTSHSKDLEYSCSYFSYVKTVYWHKKQYQQQHQQNHKLAKNDSYQHCCYVSFFDRLEYIILKKIKVIIFVLGRLWYFSLHPHIVQREGDMLQ